MIATIVDTEKLFQAIWTSLVGAVGVTLAFSLLVLGAARSADHGRSGRRAVAGVYGVIAVVALGACVAAIVLALIIMTTK
jgi:hypothetical protein